MDNKQAEEIIDEIWHLIKHRPNLQSFHNIDSQQILDRSNQMLSQSQHHDNTLRLHEASQFIQQQHDYVKSYIKHKIQSNLFRPKRQIPSHQLSIIRNQKQQLIAKLQAEQLRDQHHKSTIISNTRKFRNYQKYTNLPIIKIDSLMQNQPYVDNHPEEQVVHSRSNEILQSPSNSPSNLHLPNAPQTDPIEVLIQYQDAEQNQEQFNSTISKGFQQAIQNKLKQSHRFVKVFQVFLEKNLRLTQKIDSTVKLIKQLSVRSLSKKSQTQVKIYRKNTFTKKKPINHKNLNQIIKGKNTRMIKMIQMQFDQNQYLCSMIINKLIGDSNSFHIKKCTLTPNLLYYTNQTDVDQKELKKMQLVPQQLEISQMKKQQGTFFNRKEQNVEVVVVKGTQRKFIFQKNALQGRQFLMELEKLMAFKFYRINCLISESKNQQLQNFIVDKNCKQFSLTNNFILPFDKYPFKDLREKTINNLVNMLEKRPNIESIVIDNCQLQQKQAIKLFNSFIKCFQINKIRICKLKITKILFQSLILLLKNSKSAVAFQLELIQCQLSDDIILSNILTLKKIIHRISNLNLSYNNKLTQKSTNQIMACFSSNTIGKLQIKSINLSYCSIQNFQVIIELLKSTPQLTTIIAQGCSFEFNETIFKQLFKVCDKNKIQRVCLKNNQPLSDIIWLSKNWKTNYPKIIELQIGRFCQRMSKALKAECI